MAPLVTLRSGAADESAFLRGACRFDNGMGAMGGNMGGQPMMPSLPGVELPGQPMASIGSNLQQLRNAGMNDGGAGWGGAGTGHW